VIDVGVPCQHMMIFVTSNLFSFMMALGVANPEPNSYTYTKITIVPPFRASNVCKKDFFQQAISRFQH
jgi:hypothetical protein